VHGLPWHSGLQLSALKAYRAGERDHATMDLQASALSDVDIEDIAAYFASLGKD
jgi:cytochrome c553